MDQIQLQSERSLNGVLPNVAACRCRDCAAVLEEYDEETLCLAVVALSMFIHLSPDLAAPMLLDIMQSVGRYSHSSRPRPHAALQR